MSYTGESVSGYFGNLDVTCQLHTPRLKAAFLGQFVEDEFLKLQLLKENQRKDIEAMKEKLASSEKRLGQMTKLEEEITWLKEELKKLTGECDIANKNAALAEEKVSRYDQDLEELKMDTAVKHLPGFHKAVEQVQALYTDLDLSELDVFKIVKDGRLIMVSSPTYDAIGEDMDREP